MPSKYEREIAEILERMERQGTAPPAEPPRRPPRPRWPRPSLQFQPSLRSGSFVWLGLAIGLPLAAALLNGLVPWLAPILVIAGILIFLSPLALRLAGWLKPDNRRMWRGQVIDMPYRGGGDTGAWWRYQVWRWRRRLDRWRGR
jgi:hypothetical protein